MSEQLELPLDEVPDDRLYFEDLTLTADTVLANNIGKFSKVFIIGVDDEGFAYCASDNNGMFWLYALDRAQDFLKEVMR